MSKQIVVRTKDWIRGEEDLQEYLDLGYQVIMCNTIDNINEYILEKKFGDEELENLIYEVCEKCGLTLMDIAQSIQLSAAKGFDLSQIKEELRGMLNECK